MVITKTLFATRTRRVVAPLLCLILAVTAILVGDGLGMVVAAGLVLLAVLAKVAAELSGRETRLESRARSARRDIDAGTTSLGSLEASAKAAEAGRDALAARLDEAMATIARIEKRQQELDDRMGGVIDALQPVRRHRLLTGDAVPDLSLQSSIEPMLRRFREGRGES